ncbi:MAG TPA: TonB-dependent receptor [Vicinamibacterales bacterium]|nr:TonB-dependent receptor [Vicinamibacterales bacterium]
MIAGFGKFDGFGKFRRFGMLAIAVLMIVSPALAQTRNDAGKLIVTVVDPSGGVIPNASVTIVGLEAATKAATAAPVKTNDKGLATFDALPPGRYSITGEFPGFDLGLLKDIRIKAGENKHVLVLPLRKMSDSVTVGRDPQQAAADRAATFGTAMTREQIDALSDDPDEMARQLQDIAGPDAVLRIDSFEGGRLPPKAQIKSIHITRDAFAAENHFAGGIFVDVITQPGIGALRGNANLRYHDGAWNGISPLTPTTKSPSMNGNFGGGLGGTLVKEKSNFSLNLNGGRSYTTPTLNAALPVGTVTRVLNLQTTTTNSSAFGLLDYAVTKDQTLRFSYNGFRFSERNLGVGNYDLPERAYSSDSYEHYFRMQEAGPLKRRFFISTRGGFSVVGGDQQSATAAPTIRVNDAFTSGGAQVTGGRHTKTFTLQSDLDYVRGKHSFRMGVLTDGGWYNSNDFSNYLGTYTFASQVAYDAGTPTSYTRRIGDPNISYFNVQVGVYVQDDIRLRKNLTLSPGIRYEVQTHLADYNNVGPRFGVTWAPFKSGKTTLRMSAGMFYDWLPANTYEQTLRVDGFRQRELNIENPDYPVPGVIGTTPPTNRYVLGSSLAAPRTTRVSAGIDQTITPRVRVSGTYAATRGGSLFRALNQNAPINGVRPDEEFANIVEVVSDAHSRAQSASINGSFSFAAPSPTLQAKRFNWRRTSINAGYYAGKSENNTDGAFAILPGNTPNTEWGPAPGDIRQRVNLGINTSMLKNFSSFLSIVAGTGTPYSLRTGYDDNGDLIFNDRPQGVGRNTLRQPGQWTVNGNFSYSLSFGKRKVALPPGISIISSGGGLVASAAGPPPDISRYRVSIGVSIFNLTNHANYTGYSGVMISPFFGKPQSVQGMRRVDLSINLSF